MRTALQKSHQAPFAWSLLDLKVVMLTSCQSTGLYRISDMLLKSCKVLWRIQEQLKNSTYRELIGCLWKRRHLKSIKLCIFRLLVPELITGCYRSWGSRNNTIYGGNKNPGIRQCLLPGSNLSWQSNSVELSRPQYVPMWSHLVFPRSSFFS